MSDYTPLNQILDYVVADTTDTRVIENRWGYVRGSMAALYKKNDSLRKHNSSCGLAISNNSITVVFDGNIPYGVDSIIMGMYGALIEKYEENGKKVLTLKCGKDNLSSVGKEFLILLANVCALEKDDHIKELLNSLQHDNPRHPFRVIETFIHNKFPTEAKITFNKRPKPVAPAAERVRTSGNIELARRLMKTPLAPDMSPDTQEFATTTALAIAESLVAADDRHARSAPSRRPVASSSSTPAPASDLMHAMVDDLMARPGTGTYIEPEQRGATRDMIHGFTETLFGHLDHARERATKDTGVLGSAALGLSTVSEIYRVADSTLKESEVISVEEQAAEGKTEIAKLIARDTLLNENEEVQTLKAIIESSERGCYDVELLENTLMNTILPLLESRIEQNAPVCPGDIHKTPISEAYGDIIDLRESQGYDKEFRLKVVFQEIKTLLAAADSSPAPAATFRH